MKEWIIGCGLIASAVGIFLTTLRQIRMFDYENSMIPPLICSVAILAFGLVYCRKAYRRRAGSEHE